MNVENERYRNSKDYLNKIFAAEVSRTYTNTEISQYFMNAVVVDNQSENDFKSLLILNSETGCSKGD